MYLLKIVGAFLTRAYLERCPSLRRLLSEEIVNPVRDLALELLTKLSIYQREKFDEEDWMVYMMKEHAALLKILFVIARTKGFEAQHISLLMNALQKTNFEVSLSGTVLISKGVVGILDSEKVSE